MHPTARALLSALAAAALVFGAVACSDEDGDGATTDEEVGEVDDTLEDADQQIEEEVDEGDAEAGLAGLQGPFRGAPTR